MILYIYYLLLLLSLPAAIYFFVLFARSRRRTCLAAALLWLLPIPYEAIALITCGDAGLSNLSEAIVGCNIRVDLLVVFPVEFGVLVLISAGAYGAYHEVRKSS